MLILILVLIVGCGISIYVHNKNVPTKDTVISYLERQRDAFLNDDLSDMQEYDEKIEKMIAVHVGYGVTLDQIMLYVARAEAVQQVKAIPGLERPFVFIGDRIRGNNEKLYYSKSGHILEITLNDMDRLMLLLQVTRNGQAYPRVRKAYSEGIISQIQSEINYGDKDIVKIANGEFSYLSIRTQETAEMLYRCIRNCKYIEDATYDSCKPLCPRIEVSENCYGDLHWLYVNYQKTGQTIHFCFEDEDAQALYKYIMLLQ